MSVSMNGVVVLDDDGKCTPDFNAGLLGEQYKDSKVFEGISDLTTLMKVCADSKIGMSRKLENVIQKPAENATEQQKAEYRKLLQRELGAAEKPEDYEFHRPESLPDGMTYDENVEALFRQVFFELGVPRDAVKALSQKFNEMQLSRHNDMITQQKKEFGEAAASLDKDWTGDARLKNNRITLKAVQQFADADLKKLIQDSKLSEDVVNHEKWNSLGISPQQRRIWHNIGMAMKSDEAITNEGTPAPSAGETTPKSAAAKIYTHPTSQRELGGVKR